MVQLSVRLMEPEIREVEMNMRLMMNMIHHLSNVLGSVHTPSLTNKKPMKAYESRDSV